MEKVGRVSPASRLHYTPGQGGVAIIVFARSKVALKERGHKRTSNNPPSVHSFVWVLAQEELS